MFIPLNELPKYWEEILREDKDMYFHSEVEDENVVIDESLIEWMTEPTNPNMVPRADNG